MANKDGEATTNSQVLRLPKLRTLCLQFALNAYKLTSDKAEPV